MLCYKLLYLQNKHLHISYAILRISTLQKTFDFYVTTVVFYVYRKIRAKSFGHNVLVHYFNYMRQNNVQCQLNNDMLAILLQYRYFFSYRFNIIFLRITFYPVLQYLHFSNRVIVLQTVYKSFLLKSKKKSKHLFDLFLVRKTIFFLFSVKIWVSNEIYIL